MFVETEATKNLILMKNRIPYAGKAIAVLAMGTLLFTSCQKVDESTTDASTAERKSRWGRWQGGSGGSGGTTDTTTTPTIPTTPGTTDPSAPTGGTAFKFTALTSDFSRPESGAEIWYNGFQVPISGVTASDRYIRFNWSGLNPGQGQYNWTLFDQEINKAIDAKQGFSFGIMTQYYGGKGSAGIANFEGGYSAYPQWLHNQMKAESVKPVLKDGDWVHSYNSPAYLKAFDDFCKALYQHLSTTTYKGVLYKNVISYIDIRGYGNFGEWHNWPYGNSPDKPTVASLKRIIDIQKNAFRDIRLQAMISAVSATDSWSAVTPEVAYYLLTASNEAGPFGIRRDNWGATEAWYNQDAWENNSKTYNGVALKNLIMDKWKTAPITGEPCCNSGYAALPSQVTKYHVNSFGNGNYGSVTASNIVAASKAAGARLALTAGSLSAGAGSLTITLNWSNTGVAPVYRNWNVVYELRNGSTVVRTLTSSFNPKLFLPGTKTVTDNFSGIPAGTYNLVLKIVDPTGYRTAYPLAISGRASDGSYALMNSVVIK